MDVMVEKIMKKHIDIATCLVMVFVTMYLIFGDRFESLVAISGAYVLALLINRDMLIKKIKQSNIVVDK